VAAGAEQPVALISGAARGIGREVARQLAAADYYVLLGARRPADGEREAGQIEAEGGRVSVIELDVADPVQIEAAMRHVEADPGRLDVLVNNAGIMDGGYGRSIEDAEVDSIKAVMETNTFGALRLIQAALPLLRRSAHPRIVNVSSGAGQLDDMQGGMHGYRLSKVALNAITRIVATEEAENGILANSLCPGWVRTDMGTENAPRSVQEGADTAVWLARLPDDGPTAGFFRDREPIPW
jgi:NAD(P)-dependent dehydrogenase (short-subunit alcohol dehydrogenase family)